MYEVLLERSAARDLRKLPAEEFTRIIGVIRSLAETPRPPGCRKIAGSKSDWRIRVGDYRVIYEIEDAVQVLRVMRVRHRRDSYRKS
ncbi:MAG: type II toxin-antitoxin system RelE/ParE family toxin [Chloroflexi bacterium]|nr:type II toxin-antitoxin system RelE/ParE family toxin [Chloroflexota bacterium]